MRIRRLLFRLSAVLATGVMVGAVAAVAPAQVAVAASSDLVLSVTAADLGVDAATLRSVVSDVNAEDTRDGISLDQAAKRSLQEFGYATSNWANLDISASVSAGGTLTITLPGSEVSTNANTIANTVSTMVGIFVTYAFRAACVSGLTASGVGAALVPVICTPIGAALGALVGSLIQGAFDGDVKSADFWTNTIIRVAFAVVGGFTWEKYISPWAKTGGADLVKRIASTLSSWATTIKTFFATAAAVLQGVANTVADVAAQLPGRISTFDASLPATGPLPCDTYDGDGANCVASYSTVRALYSYYGGPLYQVQRASDNTKADIGLLTIGGYVNASEQDSFCAGTSCVISKIYDQGAQWNDLTLAPNGGAAGGDHLADANALPITANGHEAYGVYFGGQTGYRNNNAVGTAGAGQAEGMYMVASGTNVNDGCCFDFGNAERNSNDTGNGHMDAVNLGTKCYFAPCTGAGPWVEADLENGLFSGGNGSNLANKGNGSNFVTALLKNNGQTTYALKGGDSQSGGLSTWWNGGLPTIGGYKPMQQEGGIILGIGGDNSNWSVGSFFEGAMTYGYPSDAADDKAQSSIVAAGYAGNSGGVMASSSPSAAGPAVIHDGYSSVYTVNSANGHLQETYLPKMGDPWSSQDLSAKYGTPAVMPGTKPVSVTHDGYTSVFTVDAGSGHIQETYLPKMGDPWTSQDLSAKYGAPATSWTPTAVVHDGYTSVWSVNQVNGHLQETYLPKMGDPWSTQDLSAKYGTPQVEAGTSPVAVVHTKYTSVYTVDANRDLQETYLPAMGDPWSTQDLSANYGTPKTTVTPTAVVHGGYTSVYTVDDGSQHLQETYLPKMGDPWHSQDLSANYGTPAVDPGTQPVAFVHTGYTSVYTVDEGSLHLRESYLSAVGDPWTSQDLSAKYGTPPTDDTPVVLLHPDASGAVTWSSIFTVDESNQHLQETYLPTIGNAWTSQDLSGKYGTPAVATPQASAASGWTVVHDGYASAFTVDKSNQHLQETYLPAMGQPWSTQDLSAQFGTPAVLGGTATAAITHDGYTSAYTVDASNGHLQETYLTAMGQPWHTQDLSAQFGTPASNTTPTALYHDGYTSVYTVDKGTGHLWETYLSGIGANWVSQDLSAKYGTPAVLVGTAPTSVMHSGWTSVYTTDANGHVQETYLPAIGDPWVSQDLSAKYGTPASITGPGVLVHDGYTSVYTVDSNHDLQETYLRAIGDDWVTQDFTANYGTPTVASGMAPIALYHTGYASVYTVDQSNNDVQETYLPAISDNWTSQDLSSKYGTPAANQPPSVLEHADTTGALTWTSIFTVTKSNADLEESYLSGIGANWVAQDLSAKYGVPQV